MNRKNLGQFIAIFVVSYILLVTVFAFAGEHWARLFLPLIKREIEWVNRGYRVDSVSFVTSKSGQQEMIFRVSGKKELLTSRGPVMVDHGESLAIVSATLSVCPLIAVPLIAALPFASTRRRVLAIVISLAGFVIVYFLDTTFFVTYKIESGFYQGAVERGRGTFAVEPEPPGWWYTYWYYFLNNGGRQFLSILVAGASLWLAGSFRRKRATR